MNITNTIEKVKVLPMKYGVGELLEVSSKIDETIGTTNNHSVDETAPDQVHSSRLNSFSLLEGHWTSNLAEVAVSQFLVSQTSIL